MTFSLHFVMRLSLSNLYQYGLYNSVKEPHRLNQVLRVWDGGWGWWSVGKRKQGEEGVRPEDGQGERQTDRQTANTDRAALFDRPPLIVASDMSGRQ